MSKAYKDFWPESSNNWRSGAATAVFLLFLIFLPLPRHWPLLRQTYPSVYYELTSFDVYLSDVVALLLVATSFLLNRRVISPFPRRLIGPLAGLVLLTAVSSLNAFDVALTGQQTARLLLLLAVCAVIIRLRPAPRWVQVGLAASVGLQTAVALRQFGLQDDLGLRWLGELDLNRYPGGGSILEVGGTYWLRAYGLTPHPNILGGILAGFLPALVVPFLKARQRAKLVWLAVLLSGLAGLLFTFSRAAGLGGLAGGSFLVFGVVVNREWRQRYGRSLLLLIVIGGLFLGGLAWSQRALLFSRVMPSANEFETRSVNERAALLSAGWQLAALNPLTGIGAGNTAVAIAPLVSDLPDVGAQPVHNMPLLLGIELGLPGAALWLWLMIYPVGWALARLKQGQLSLWAWGVTAVLVTLAVIGLFDYYTWSWQQGRLLQWTAWGLWGAAATEETGMRDEG